MVSEQGYLLQIRDADSADEQEVQTLLPGADGKVVEVILPSDVFL